MDQLYELLHSDKSLEVVEPINDTFYKARQFVNGYVLYFIQDLDD